MFKSVKKISTKLLLAFIAVALISSIAGVVGVVMLRTTDQAYGRALVDYGFAQGYIGKLGMALNANRAYIRDVVFLTKKSDLDVAYAKIQDAITYSNEMIEKIRPTATTPETKELFAQIEAELEDYREVRDKVLQMGMKNDRDGSYTLWMNTAAPKVDSVVAKVEALLEMNVSAGTAVSKSLTINANISFLIMMATIASGLLISAVLALLVSKSISRPVIAVQKAARQLARGDLDIQVDSNNADEVGEMARSFSAAAVMLRTIISDLRRGLSEVAAGNFDISSNAEFPGDFKAIEDSINQIIVSLSDTLSQINHASEQVASGSEQVSSGAQALSQGATEQASSIQQLSATITEISQQIRENAGNASDAKQQSERSGNEVLDSNTKMEGMIAAMNDISQKSGEIGKIIKTIEDIAFQTNILALNAAVEAARAGAAGKGFAVVADEVRNLAGKSAEAAKNTTRLIEETVSAVDNGTRIADDTAQSMMAVVDSTKAVTKLIDLIATASGEQAMAVNQVTMGVEQISTVVQTNSATAEQSAAASEELSSQAQMLKTLVGRFRLRGALNNRPVAAVPHQESASPKDFVASAGGKY